jgi:hypothetical protein
MMRLHALLSSAAVLAAADATDGSTPQTQRRAVRKQLRWYLGNPAEVQEYMTGANTEHYLNDSAPVSDITGGIYQCCNGQSILANGSLGPYNASAHPWNLTAFAHLEMYHTLSIYGNCSATGTPAGCWSVGQTCSNALARAEGFTTEIMGWLDAYQLKGLNLDWEFGYGNNVSCHMALWSHVSKTLRAHGKELALSVDDSKGLPFNPSLTNWSYETDWALFQPYADILINMGTYPGGWAQGIAYPAWQYLHPYKCKPPANTSRTCGVVSQCPLAALILFRVRIALKLQRDRYCRKGRSLI